MLTVPDWNASSKWKMRLGTKNAERSTLVSHFLHTQKICEGVTEHNFLDTNARGSLALRLRGLLVFRLLHLIELGSAGKCGPGCCRSPHPGWWVMSWESGFIPS